MEQKCGEGKKVRREGFFGRGVEVGKNIKTHTGWFFGAQKQMHTGYF